MGKDLLNEFVRAGYLDASVTEGFDPYYEPSWWRGEDCNCEDAAWGEFDGCDTDAGDCFASLSF